MAQSKTTKSDEFDSIIVGAGLTGLLAAHQLEGTGRKVALIEGLDALGGSCRPSHNKAGPIDHGLKFLPDCEEAHEALAWLGSVLGEKIKYEIVEAPPVTYDDGKFKPFVGFGDQNVRTAHEVNSYAKERYLYLASTPKDWVPRLSETFTGSVNTQSYVTKFQADDEFIIDTIINGAKRLSGREVLFCAAPQQLARLLPETHVPVRLRQRLLKGEVWTSVNLDLVHAAPVTDSRAVHVLKGANEEPSVGLFYPPTIDNAGVQRQVSQWLTLVPRDLSDDDETMASALKQIKRQIKRAYESSLDCLVQERIIVNPSSHGDLTGILPEDGRWPKIQNLWIVSGLLDSSKNLLGSMRQARRSLAAIAGEPAVPIVTDSDLADSRPQPTA
jgi:hypothetical protein